MSIIVDPKIKSHIPPLRADEYATLEELILRDGCTSPLVVWNNVLIDGHNRYEICTKHSLSFEVDEIDFPDFESAIIWIEENQLGRRNLTADQFAYFIGKKYDRQKKQGARTDLTSRHFDEKSNGTNFKLADEHGMSTRTVERAAEFSRNVDAIADAVGDEARSEILGSKDYTRADVAEIAEVLPMAKQEGLSFASAKDAMEWAKQQRAAKVEAKRAEKIAVTDQIRERNADLPLSERKYSAIYADPPWSFNVWSGEGKDRAAENHYPTMTLDEIKAMPVGQIAADDCALFMWIVWPELPGALDVIKAWGFEYKTCAFNWVKQNRNTESLFWGMGYWTRANSEVCLIATKGSPPRLNADVHQVLMSPVMEHSRKPDEIADRIMRLVPGPYIELFARRPRDGWDLWGNQATDEPAEAAE